MEAAMDTQTELEQLRAEVAELRKALGNKHQLSAPNLPSLINDEEFILLMTRFSEGLESEKTIRTRYRFSDADWERLGSDDALVEKIGLLRAHRVRSGATKREKAQKLIVKGPEILDSIATSSKASDKHKIDAVKALDALADPGAQAAHDDSERVIVTINLGADQKLVFNKSVKPNPNDTDGEIIDVTPPVPGFAITEG
jgi:hypothetical protein